MAVHSTGVANTIPAYSSTVDPVAANIPTGTAQVWKNTTGGAVKLWYNDAGTLKSVTLV